MSSSHPHSFLIYAYGLPFQWTLLISNILRNSCIKVFKSLAIYLNSKDTGDTGTDTAGCLNILGMTAQDGSSLIATLNWFVLTGTLSNIKMGPDGRQNGTGFLFGNATVPTNTTNGTGSGLEWTSWTSESGFDVKILYIPLAVLGFTGNCMVLIG